MTQVTIESNVADIVKDIPQTGDLFRKLRIDFCCGGKIPLKKAAIEKNLNPDLVLKEIQQIQQENHKTSTHSLKREQLIKHIQNKHHAFLKEELPMLTPYVTRVSKKHGETHPHLIRVRELFTSLRIELQEHTEDEDQNVFPMMIEFYKDSSLANAEKLKPHLIELESEHENCGNLLKELREITNQFTPPKDACGTYQYVYFKLENLEKNTFEHIHLENNILFDDLRKTILNMN